MGISLLAYPINGFITVRDVHRNRIINFKKKGGKPPKTILIFFYWLFSLPFFVLISLLLIISNTNFSSGRSYSSAVKNGLVNGIKECVVLNSDNQTTRFSDVQSFQGNYRRFKIESLDQNSCYKAKAVPTNNQNTWFQIDLNMETGKLSKTCGDSSKPGCDKENTW